MATSNLRYLYWTPYQQLAHHASAMCGLKTGDLCGTGTISGAVCLLSMSSYCFAFKNHPPPMHKCADLSSIMQKTDRAGKKLELGCLYEATEAGTKSLTLSDGKPLQYLNDGDEIILEAWCGDGDGKGKRLGFGSCRGKILPAA